jgi:hypothetical protein
MNRMPGHAKMQCLEWTCHTQWGGEFIRHRSLESQCIQKLSYPATTDVILRLTPPEVIVMLKKITRTAAILTSMTVGGNLIGTPKAPAQLFPFNPQPQQQAQKLPWLHEGLQITATRLMFILPGTSLKFTEDPTGNWHDQSGHSYSATANTGTSIAGLHQFIITAIDGDKALLQLCDFTDARPSGLADIVPLAGVQTQWVSTTDADEYWKDPQILASMKTDASNGIYVNRVQWPNGNITHDAYKIERIARDSYSSQVYDAQTGQCLHDAEATQGAPPVAVVAGEQADSDTYLTQFDFISNHNAQIPWGNDPLPAAAQNLRTMHFQGSQSILDPRIPAPSPRTMDISITGHGNGWTDIDVLMGPQAPGVNGIALKLTLGRYCPDPLWISPQRLATLHQGQVIDQNDTTRIKVFVVAMDQNSVTIEQANSSGGYDYRYDLRTGLETGQRYVSMLAHQQTVRQVTGEQ